MTSWWPYFAFGHTTLISGKKCYGASRGRTAFPALLCLPKWNILFKNIYFLILKNALQVLSFVCCVTDKRWKCWPCFAANLTKPARGTEAESKAETKQHLTLSLGGRKQPLAAAGCTGASIKLPEQCGIADSSESASSFQIRGVNKNC